MPRPQFRRNLISALLITLVLPSAAFASMLDPEGDFASDKSAPVSSSESLKEKLDAARQNAGTPSVAVPANVPPLVTAKPAEQNKQAIIKTPDPIIHKETVYAGTLDDTKPSGQKIVSQPAATAIAPPPVQTEPAKAVSQQIVRFDGNAIAAPASDMHDLLFDDVVQKPAASSSPAVPAATMSMPSVPTATPILDDYVPAPVPDAVAPPVKEFNQKKEFATVPAVAMPPPAAMPLPPVMKNTPAYAVSDNAPPPAAVPAPEPVKPYVPAVEIRKAPAVSSSRFKPMPSKAKGQWAMRDLKPTSASANDAMCLLQNRFDNNQTLVIGQDSLGRILLAVDYGIPMLVGNQEYTPKIQIDENYSKDIPAYANGSSKLMVQIEKDPAFLAALQSGDALHVGMKGTASTFALDNMDQGLQSLARCVTDIGGPALPAALLKNTASSETTQMPAVPIPSITQENIASSAPAIPAPPPIVKPQGGYWPDVTLGLIKQSGIQPYELQTGDTQIRWSNANKLLQASAQLVPVADLIDASSLLLDKSEKTCGGQFGSQMGIPEKRGNSDVLQMESKCVRNGTIMVSTWLIAKDALGVTAWQFEAPRDDRGLAFDARQQILNALSAR